MVTDDGVENAAALDRFIEDWEDGKDSSIYLIKEGKQGKAACNPVPFPERAVDRL